MTDPCCWSAAAELAPGETVTSWPRYAAPPGKLLNWTSLSLRVKVLSMDLSDAAEAEAAARMLECVRSNSFVNACVSGKELLAIRADEIPSPVVSSWASGTHGPLGGSAYPHAKDVTLAGKAIKVQGNDILSFSLNFVADECRCDEPHSRPARLELSVNGELVPEQAGGRMRTIWYLLNLTHKSVVDSFEGRADEQPELGLEIGEKLCRETGDKFVLARGKVFFQ